VLEGRTNVALGVASGMHYTSTRVDLLLGSTLIAYTDGLIERHTGSLDDSLAALVDVVSGAERESVDDLCDRLHITVVAIRFTAD
jgi:serine phosphatase RsbU (regulator of sigma subunit)